MAVKGGRRSSTRATTTTTAAVVVALTAVALIAAPASPAVMVHGFQAPPARTSAGPIVGGRGRAPSTTTTTSATALSALPVVAAAAAAGVGTAGAAAAATASSSPATLAATLAALESPLGSVTVLAFVICFHELGHFLAARSMGIRVSEFSVGVGPKVAGFQRRVVGNDDGGGNGGSVERAAGDDEDNEDDADVIDFNLRAIPVGGYVRFPENYNSTLAFEVEETNRELRQEQRDRRKELQTKGKMGTEGRDASDMVMGASDTPTGFMRFLTFGDTVTGRDKREEERMLLKKQKKAEAAAAAAKEEPKWKTFFTLGGGGDKAKQEDDTDPLTRLPQEIEYYDDPDLLQNRPWFQRAAVLSGGVVFNIVLAFACYFGELTVGSGLPHPTFDRGALITAEPRGDGPSFDVLRRGDVIIGVNGDPISRSLAPRASEAQDDISKFIASIRNAEEGTSLTLSVLRPTVAVKSNDVRAMAKVERRPTEVTIKPRPSGGGGGDSSEATSATKGPMSIGVMLAPNYQGTDLVRAENVLDAAVKAGGAVQEVTSDTARSVLQLLGGLLMGKGAPAGQSVSGPIGVIKAGSDVVSTNDIRAVIGFAAAISINLAVINSLPLPALDGGQLVFVLAEAVTGRKIDQRLQENINAAVVLMLLFLSVGTAIGDVEAIALGR